MDITYDVQDSELKLIQTYKPMARQTKMKKVRKNYKTDELYQDTESGATDKLQLTIIDSTGDDVHLHYKGQAGKENP